MTLRPTYYTLFAGLLFVALQSCTTKVEVPTWQIYQQGTDYLAILRRNKGSHERRIETVVWLRIPSGTSVSSSSSGTTQSGGGSTTATHEMLATYRMKDGRQLDLHCKFLHDTAAGLDHDLELLIDKTSYRLNSGRLFQVDARAPKPIVTQLDPAIELGDLTGLLDDPQGMGRIVTAVRELCATDAKAQRGETRVREIGRHAATIGACDRRAQFGSSPSPSFAAVVWDFTSSPSIPTRISDTTSVG